FGNDHAWGNGVDANVVRAELRCQGIRQLLQSALARVVGTTPRASAPIVSRRGRDVDNDAATPLQCREGIFGQCLSLNFLSKYINEFRGKLRHYLELLTLDKSHQLD